MKTKLLLLSMAILMLPHVQTKAQEKSDSTEKTKKKKEKPVPLVPYHRNTIKFNPTPMLLWGNIRNITLSYERVIGNNHSLSLQLGYLLFPKITDDTIVNLIALKGGEKDGINVAFDYRYYPFSRNRRPAPDGLYIGGYLSYYGFQFKNSFNILHTTLDQNGTLSGKLNVVNLGVSLGYQFIFWKRFSVDLLLFGPAASFYHGDLEIKGNLDKEAIEDINEELVKKLVARFPSLKELFSEEGLKFTGNRTELGIGFRYSIQLGFHF